MSTIADEIVSRIKASEPEEKKLIAKCLPDEVLHEEIARRTIIRDQQIQEIRKILKMKEK